MAGTRRARESTTTGTKKAESLKQLRLRAATCKRCDLWKSGTQTVFGAGPARADLMLVGEQPGDVEDLPR